MMITIAQDTFARANQSGLGTASDGESWTFTGFGTPSIVSNRGQITGATGANRPRLGNGIMMNGDITVRMSLSSTTDNIGFIVRYVDTNNYVQVSVASGSITVRVVVANVGTNLTPTTGISLSINTNYQLHINLNNNVYSVNVWLDGTSEPGGWVCQATDSVGAATRNGQYGLYALIGTTSDIILFDSFLVTSTPPTITVSPGGNDTTGDGSLGNPYATITKADTVVASGGTVNVLPGTYTQASTWTLNTNGTPLAHIVYQSAVRWGALLRTTTVQKCLLINGSYVDIVGFDVSTDSAGDAGIWTIGSGYRIKQNYIHDIPCPDGATLGGAGIDIHWTLGTETVAEVSSNFIVNIGAASADTTHSHGIYFQIGQGNLFNNLCINIKGGFGIKMAYFATNTTCCNNALLYCAGGGILIVGGTTGTGGGDPGVTLDFMVVNNNIIRDAYADFTEAIHESSTLPITTGTHNQYVDNLIYGGSSTGFSLNNGIVDVGTLRVDPKMANYQIDGSGDYRLLPGSPCINAGTSTGAPSIDFDGIARPFGAGYDIGPFEWHGGIYYTYGNFQINDHQGGLGYFLMSKDLDFPEFKPAISPLALYDGNKITGYQVAHRQIQCEIYVVGTSRTDCIARKDQLEKALALRDQQLILHEDGRYWIANAISGKTKFAAGKGIVQAQIPVTFVCANPYAIATTAASPFDSGNVAYTTLVVAGTYKSTFFYVAAGGTIYTWPTITLTHQLATPGSTTLNGALTQGSQYTAITVTSSPALTAGQVIKLSWTTGGNTFVQKLVVSSAVTSGATSIPVNAFTASASFPITSTSVLVSTAWNNVTIAQLTDNYSIQANGNNDQTYEIFGGNSVASGVFLLPQVQGDFITINCDPTASNGWTITGSVQGVSFTYQPNGAFPPLEPGNTQFQVTIASDSQPTAQFHMTFTPRYTS